MSEQFPYTFGKYRMEAEIGRGGFGIVFRAQDSELDRPVAIKILDPLYMRDSRWVARFRREARLMARLDHPHIVPIYEIGEQDGRLFLAMKLIDGSDLTRLLSDNGPLPWKDALTMTAQIASALAFAHEQGVIHRDLKPGNILVSKGQATLTDFGLAQMMESNSQSISMSGGIAGTYNYMPPEIFNNEDVTPAADIYALGLIVYEMLTGEKLVDGKSTAAIIGAHLKGVTIPEPLPEDVPPGVNGILQKALAPNPTERYTSPLEMVERLQGMASDQLAEPYTQLEQALSEKNFKEALTLAEYIRTQNPDYRDVVALEEQAQTKYWAAQWRMQAELALLEDDFDSVRGALSQWRRVDPQDPKIKEVENNLDLARQYVVLQELIKSQSWPQAKSAADAIYARDPQFRDISTLQESINSHLRESSKEEVLIIPPVAQKRGAAAEGKIDDQGSGSSPPPPAGKAAAAPGARGLPGWIWWAGAVLGIIVIALIMRAAFFSSPKTPGAGTGSIAGVDSTTPTPEIGQTGEQPSPTLTAENQQDGEAGAAQTRPTAAETTAVTQDEPTLAPSQTATLPPGNQNQPTPTPTRRPPLTPTQTPTAPPPFAGLDIISHDCNDSRIASINALDRLTVQFELCDIDPAFLSKIALPPFGIQPQEWLEANFANGDVLRQPIGSGPYQFQNWSAGQEINLQRFADYWAGLAPAESLSFRWDGDSQTRLSSLEHGEVDFITRLDPNAVSTVNNNPDLQLVTRAMPDIFFIGMNNRIPPMDDSRVRQALAVGIDRSAFIQDYYPPGSTMATHFTPCFITNGCQGEDWYEFDPEVGQQLLAEAGYPDGFKLPLYYRDVVRTYLAEPQKVAEVLAEQWASNLGLDIIPTALDSGSFVQLSSTGQIDGLYLLGWFADYPHASGFLDFLFNDNSQWFGDPYPEIYKPLAEANALTDAHAAAPHYQETNDAIREMLPMIPVVHSAEIHAARDSLTGAYYPPLGAPELWRMEPSDNTLDLMQENEPSSLYCADESDADSFLVCRQIVETLYQMDPAGQLMPALAKSCQPANGGRTWTCTLREDVRFHDGSQLDANDVVVSFAAGLDASSPLHVGRSGTFAFFDLIWGIMNDGN